MLKNDCLRHYSPDYLNEVYIEGLKANHFIQNETKDYITSALLSFFEKGKK